MSAATHCPAGYPLPRWPRPIVSIGAGGIARDAHQPAYAGAGFPVATVYDRNPQHAYALARDFGIPRVAESLEQAIATAPPGAVYDLALPAGEVARTLDRLPDASAVLIQKPLGESLSQAAEIRGICRRKRLTAAVNFQLRYAPYIRGARSLIQRGDIGPVHDLEARVNVYTPWHLWEFLERLPRVEILYHSVHYVDLIRSFLGEPRRVWAHTLAHPFAAKLASSRSTILLDYGPQVRAAISTNHGHKFGLQHQESFIKWEGATGAVKARLGLLMNYPGGEPDALEICRLDEHGRPGAWEAVPFDGSWFPDAFVGPMADLMRHLDGEIDGLPTSVDDAYRTMAVVEAAYRSSGRGGEAPPAAAEGEAL